MRPIPYVLLLVLAGSVTNCATGSLSTPAGVAPEGIYAFSGIVDGEVVNGTLDFADPILLSSSHGQCVREILGKRRWEGPFGVTCPGISLVVRVEDDGRVQGLGMARINKPGVREERTSCAMYDYARNTCVVWDKATVEYDRWVEGQVRVVRQGG